MSLAEARYLALPVEVEIVYVCLKCYERFEDPMLDEETDTYGSPCCRHIYTRTDDQA